MERIADANNLIEAYRKAAKDSDWKESVQRYETRLLANTARLQRSLYDGTYRQRDAYKFTISERGKVRNIEALAIEDRVVQRSLCDNVLTPCLDPLLIYDNGASRENMGIDFTRRRVAKHLRDFYRCHGTNGYALLTDFSGFFASIPHDRLEKSVEGRLGGVEPFFDYLIEANGQDKGVGIGSQISQNSGIWYPTPIDNYVKTVRGFKFYDRYMDDTATLHQSKEVLKDLLCDLVDIGDLLGLAFNPKKTLIVPLSQGITFLKMRYSFGDNGKLLMRLTNDTFKRERKKLRGWAESGMEREIVEDSYRSWRGSVMRYSSSFKRVMRTDALFRELFPKYDWRR